ncbi:hypothetical protein EV356DRAFT_455536 [Viridothelium virens]|uniref:1-alkyl-2-acetylglycerophosphocholine esterase n=1 Tax=Viridothelium virens TaxID=1048519 RepID=A0A6A6GUY2_VIRVR|nr:hypothetical protein EV356DRAFT_455536 [Viridothelium virens]
MHLFLGILAFSISPLVLASNLTTIPDDLGPYPISITTHVLQTSRNDTLAPTPQFRRLLFNTYAPVFTPDFTCPSQTNIPYMPPATLSFFDTQLSTTYGVPSGTIYRLRLQNCTSPSSSPLTAAHAPLIIFSPGAGASLYDYQTYLSAIASSGFTVIVIDHTYDAAIVEFPDGTLAFNNYPPEESNGTIAQQDYINGDVLAPLRVADVQSVLNAVEQGSIAGLEGFAGVNGTKVKAGIMGHSLGGTTAILAAATDERIVGAMGMDGTLIGEVLNKTVKVPVFIFESEGSVTSGNRVGPSFNASWHNWESRKEWVVINGTAHDSFTDLVVAADLLDVRGALPPASAQVIGTIGGVRMTNLLWRWGVGFFGNVLKGQEEGSFFKDPSIEFPEVNIVRSNL